MTPGRIAVLVVGLVAGVSAVLFMFPSLLGSGDGPKLPPTTDPVIVNAVNGRQAGFREMGTAVKNIDAALADTEPFDREFLADVHNMETNAEQIPFWFPAGSGAESGLETCALATIWQSPDEFGRLAEQLVREMRVLTQAAERRDQQEFSRQFEVVTAVCDECHESYREETD